MEIIWFGHACFQIQDDTATVVTDPFDESLGLAVPALQADVVTVSHDTARHNAISIVEGTPKVIRDPGEYEIKNVFITGHAIYPKKNVANNAIQTRNTVFIFDIDGVKICHLGDMTHVPIQSHMEALDSIDVLLIPVGGGKSLKAGQASEIISIIEPAIVIPMHYQLPGITISLEPLQKFLKEMGLPGQDPQPRFKITADGLPKKTEIVILNPQTN